MHIQIGLYGMRAQHRKGGIQPHRKRAQRKDNGNCPSSPETTQLSLSLLCTGASRTTVPPSESRMSTCQPFKRMPGFPVVFYLTGTGGISAGFHSWMSGLSSWHWCSSQGSLLWGWDIFSGRTSADISLLIHLPV